MPVHHVKFEHKDIANIHIDLYNMESNLIFTFSEIEKGSKIIEVNNFHIIFNSRKMQDKFSGSNMLQL